MSTTSNRLGKQAMEVHDAQTQEGTHAVVQIINTRKERMP